MDILAALSHIESATAEKLRALFGHPAIAAPVADAITHLSDKLDALEVRVQALEAPAHAAAAREFPLIAT